MIVVPDLQMAKVKAVDGYTTSKNGDNTIIPLEGWGQQLSQTVHDFHS